MAVRERARCGRRRCAIAGLAAKKKKKEDKKDGDGILPFSLLHAATLEKESDGNERRAGKRGKGTGGEAR